MPDASYSSFNFSSEKHYQASLFFCIMACPLALPSASLYFS
ncbi:hypothetical protein [Metallosphaera yellowstonensis]|nr:hypothetical protein [Metallosphaera yellowstonensis]